MLRAALIFILPLIVLIGGFVYMGSRSQFVQLKAALGEEAGPRIGLYGADSIGKRWETLRTAHPGLLASERHMLVIDLPFPCLYGGALMICLLVAWSILGRPFAVAWLLAPVLVLMAADWTENLIQLDQLEAFSSGGKPALSGPLLAIAGLATLVKNLAGFGSFAWLACLAWRCRSIA